MWAVPKGAAFFCLYEGSPFIAQVLVLPFSCIGGRAVAWKFCRGRLAYERGVVGCIEGFPAGFPVLFLRIRSSGSCTGRAVVEDVPLVVRGGRIPVIVSYRAVA